VRLCKPVIGASRPVGYNDVDAGVAQVLCMRVTLAAVADDRHLFARKKSKICVTVVVHLCHLRSSPLYIFERPTRLFDEPLFSRAGTCPKARANLIGPSENSEGPRSLPTSKPQTRCVR